MYRRGHEESSVPCESRRPLEKHAAPGAPQYPSPAKAAENMWAGERSPAAQKVLGGVSAVRARMDGGEAIPG